MVQRWFNDGAVLLVHSNSWYWSDVYLMVLVQQDQIQISRTCCVLDFRSDVTFDPEVVHLTHGPRFLSDVQTFRCLFVGCDSGSMDWTRRRRPRPRRRLRLLRGCGSAVFKHHTLMGSTDPAGLKWLWSSDADVHCTHRRGLKRQLIPLIWSRVLSSVSADGELIHSWVQ